MKEEKSQCKRNRKEILENCTAGRKFWTERKEMHQKNRSEEKQKQGNKNHKRTTVFDFHRKKKRVSVSRGYLIALLKISSGHFAVLLEKPSKWETKPVYLV